MKATKKILFITLISSFFTSCDFSFTSSSSKNTSTSLKETTSPSFNENTSSFIDTTSSSSSNSSINKLIQITWLQEPVISSYYGEELTFSSYGSINALYSNNNIEKVNLTKDNLKTNRADIYSLENQVIYAYYKDLSLKFEFKLTKQNATSSIDFTKKMGVGWNLGNSFSSFFIDF